MINWRKPIIYGLLYLSGSKIPKYLREIRRVEKLSKKEIKKYQEEKLKRLLLHSWKNVPYYKKILEKSKVVVNGEVNLKNFNKIPILTKGIIRKEGKNLYSKDYKERKSYENTSGGSTGEPVKFIQDKDYDYWNIATKIYFNEKLGKHIGEKEIKLWGSDRDIIKGNLTFKDRIINYIYNRKFFNSYNFSKKDMIKLVGFNNSFKPTVYWAYVDAINEFSKFIIKNNIKLTSPKIIITTIGPLCSKNKKIIEKAFNCEVYNQYGSREMGGISCQNKKTPELNVFFWRQFVEILQVEKNKSKKQGKLIITSLENYSMPLIRYKIGDIAIKGNEHYNFNETESYLSLKNIIGRTLGFFKKKDGTLIHTHFIVQQLFFKDWIKKFQIIQKSHNLIVCNVVLEKEKNEENLKEIEQKIKLVMGENCKIKWSFVKEIEPTKSGKFLYTISKVR